MNRKIQIFTLTALLVATAGTAIACEYKSGETKFLDYANCRYGDDSVEVVTLPENSPWETCIYYVEAFRPAKLLAVTRTNEGKEVISINDRSQIGNPCYLTKQRCDVALKAAMQ